MLALAARWANGHAAAAVVQAFQTAALSFLFGALLLSAFLVLNPLLLLSRHTAERVGIVENHDAYRHPTRAALNARAQLRLRAAEH